ncbi:MAG: hypothetical protein LBE99_03985 [Puniceicoccales bacterium]|jgi:hypothetical protein|nr:hypothetical protein [Puniceicoccales bacterium]
MHIYFFAILPICWIYIKNCDELPLQHIVIIAIALGIVTACINGFLRLICKKTYNAYFPLVSFGWLSFWYSIPIARILIFGRHRIAIWDSSVLPPQVAPIIVTYKWSLAMLFAFVFGMVTFLFWRILRKKFNFTKLNRILNVWVMCISCFLLGQTVLNYFHRQNAKLPIIKNQSIEKLPNIYHIILDAYTNYHVLKETYGYDNSDFYNALEQLGFVCQKDSHSDYSGTYLSMSSVLNFGCQHSKELSETDTYFHHKLNCNEVWPSLSQKNYQLHLLEHVGIYQSPYMPANELKVSNFVKTFLAVTSDTLLKHVFENCMLQKYYQQHIYEIKTILALLHESPSRYGFQNQYFYAHILSPHEPLVFDENGNISQEQTFEGVLLQKQQNIVATDEQQEAFKKRYVNQIRAINQLVLPVLRDIINQHAENHQAPIIILHGDHGRQVCSQENPANATANLFAIYVPEKFRSEAAHLEFKNLYRWVFKLLENW